MVLVLVLLLYAVLLVGRCGECAAADLAAYPPGVATCLGGGGGGGCCGGCDGGGC